jgi:hypothetical protein
MMHMHDQIHVHFVELCGQSDAHLVATLPDKTAFLRTCFYNYSQHRKSLRLTPIGHTILQKMYECWKLPLQPEHIAVLNRGNILLQLHNNMKAPYYWDSRNFYVYHSEHALEYELVSQDFSAWIHSI